MGVSFDLIGPLLPLVPELQDDKPGVMCSVDTTDILISALLRDLPEFNLII